MWGQMLTPCTVQLEQPQRAAQLGTHSPYQPAALSSVTACRGIKLDWMQPFDRNFPFQLVSHQQLEFTVDTEGHFRSTSCSGRALAAGTPCLACSGLQFKPITDKLRTRAALKLHAQDAAESSSSSSYLNHHYLTYSQLVARVEHHNALHKAKQLDALNMERKVAKVGAVCTVTHLIICMCMPSLHALLHCLCDMHSTF